MLTQVEQPIGEGAGNADRAATGQVGNEPAPRPAYATFNLLRWFSLSSFIAIAGVAIVFATGFTRFMATETMNRDAVLTAQFIHSMVETESEHARFLPRVSLAQLIDPRVDPALYGVRPQEVDPARRELLDHIRLLPDLLLATIYAPDRRVIWSTNPSLLGKVFTENHELEEAFSSHLMVARGHLERAHDKKEQQFMQEPHSVFVENYIPLRGLRGDVVAVVELYKEPQSLLETIERGERLIWVSSALAALAVYLASFGIVRRGQAMLMRQQRRLVETETLVAIGEMSTAVAHSLRNPLATIRSSAELALDDATPAVQKNARDIMNQVDRLSGWIKDLLLYSRPQAVPFEPVALAPLIRDALAGFGSQFEKCRIQVKAELADDLPAVSGNRSLLAQALQSVLSNAIEAMPEGGVLSVRVAREREGRRLVVVISDTGKGMSPEQLALAFRPFQTSKRHGLGLGLPLVKQIMERFDGRVYLASREDVGTDVRLEFRVA